jgi:hypothetical protein
MERDTINSSETLVMSVPAAGRALGLSRNSSYLAAKTPGAMPGVIKIGKRVMISKRALDTALREGWPPPKAT